MPDSRPVSILPEPPRESLPEDIREVFAKCEDKLGFVPNVLRVYAADPPKFRAFRAMSNDLLLGDSPLSKLEREMAAVVVSAVNRCHYCLVAHSAAVRELSGDPELADILTKNYRAARLAPRVRAMLDFAHQLAEAPDRVGESDRQKLRDAGLDDRAVFHLAAVVGFFSMTNRIASAMEMVPNREYHSWFSPESARTKDGEGGEGE